MRSLTRTDKTQVKASPMKLHLYLSLVPTEKQENYFLLCDVLPEDRVLRERLQQRRLVRMQQDNNNNNDDSRNNNSTTEKQSVCCAVLHQEEVLDQQQAEREDSSFHHACMFCTEEFTGNR